MATKEKVKAPVPTGFVDYRKSNGKVITVGAIQIIGVLTKETKQSCWIVKSVPADKNQNGKVLGFFGARKDGKGVYCSSELEAICSKKGEVRETISA